MPHEVVLRTLYPPLSNGPVNALAGAANAAGVTFDTPVHGSVMNLSIIRRCWIPVSALGPFDHFQHSIKHARGERNYPLYVTVRERFVRSVPASISVALASVKDILRLRPDLSISWRKY